MFKKLKNKALGIIIVALITLLSTVSFCTLNWSYLIDCTNALNETTIGWFQTGLNCYGTTDVEPFESDAGITVYLQTLDSDGDWVTVTAWEDVGDSIGYVEEDFAVDEGRYRLKVCHKAYEEGYAETLDEDAVPLEMHWTYSVEVVI